MHHKEKLYDRSDIQGRFSGCDLNEFQQDAAGSREMYPKMHSRDW